MQLIAPDAARFWHTDSDKNPRFNILFLDWHIGFVGIEESSVYRDRWTAEPPPSE